MKKYILGFFCSVGLLVSASAQDFKFAFLTDLHISDSQKLGRVDSLIRAISPSVSLLVTGGDNIDIDGLKADQLAHGEELYKGLINSLASSKKPYYLSVGNHDRLAKSVNAENHFALFEDKAGKTNQAFLHQGWKFIILNSVQTKDDQYTVDEEQLTWLKAELANTAKDQPIVVISHVPFLSVYYPVLEGVYKATDTFKNQKEVFDLFANYNLKLILQGHMHLYEEIKVKDVQFITAGAVSGDWWNGVYHGTHPGYLEVTVKGDTFTWKYNKL